MPVITEYRHGATAGIPPTVNSHPRAPRSECAGWSESSTRRNTRFLYSVDESKLNGHGFALSLTIRDIPPTAAEFHKIRRAFLKRLERLGMFRCHWLIEWQRRKAPHIHAAVWFPDYDGINPDAIRCEIVRHWIEASQGNPLTSVRGQSVKPISDSVGWFKYLSKHAVRGLGHYQRSPENIPPGWQGRTGRMWGHLGQWDLTGPVRYLVGQDAFWKYRRMVRAWRLADARAASSSYRIKSARGMLRCHDRALSECRGVSEWIPRDMTAALVALLAAQGHEVRC